MDATTSEPAGKWDFSDDEYRCDAIRAEAEAKQAIAEAETQRAAHPYDLVRTIIKCGCWVAAIYLLTKSGALVAAIETARTLAR